MIEMCSEYWRIVGFFSAIATIIFLIISMGDLYAGSSSVVWALPIGIMLFLFTFYASTMTETTEENFMEGYEEAFSEHNYTKLQACVDYREQCGEYRNESIYKYSWGYICGYRDRSDQINVESAERNISVGEA